jgi:hypothetical protein
MRIDPQEPERLARGTRVRGRCGHRSRSEAVIAAEHQRDRTFLDRRARRLIQAIAHLGDLANELLLRVAVLLDFGNRRRQIAAIGDDPAERRDLFAKPGDAECRRSHIDPAAAAAHVEGNADQMNWRRHGRTIPVRNKRPEDQKTKEFF